MPATHAQLENAMSDFNDDWMHNPVEMDDWIREMDEDSKGSGGGPPKGGGCGSGCGSLVVVVIVIIVIIALIIVLFRH